MPCYQEKPDGLTVYVRVQPRASRNQLEGVVGDRLRIRLTAPPLEGEANKACAAYLAEVLGVPKSRVTLVAGQKSREKALFVAGEPADLVQRLERAITTK